MTNRKRLYMTHNWSSEHEGFMGVITDKHPRRGGSKVTVLDMEVKPTVAELQEWFKQMQTERPWEHTP